MAMCQMGQLAQSLKLAGVQGFDEYALINVGNYLLMGMQQGMQGLCLSGLKVQDQQVSHQKTPPKQSCRFTIVLKGAYA